MAKGNTALSFKMISLMKYFLLFIVLIASDGIAQTNWQNIDAQYAPLPTSFHVFKSTDSVNGKPNVMYYAVARLDDPTLVFSADTSMNRRLTPSQYFEKNGEPLLIMNAGFFSFATNRNLNAVVMDGKVVAFNEQGLKAHGADSGLFVHPFYGTFGILQNGHADVAWTYADSASPVLYASQLAVPFITTPNDHLKRRRVLNMKTAHFKEWKVTTAVGGGPVLVQDGKVKITNNEERKFYGKAIYDRHPRTAIGYTKDHRIILFVCEGRSESAAGLTLPQMAKILEELGCEEALNLDGGGSSCMLINGKEVNYPSSKGEQRAVPSVFMIQRKR